MQVYKGILNGVTEVAIKVLHNDMDLPRFRQEISILKRCRDNNIVNYLGAFRQAGRTMLVTEFMGQGNLFKALQTHRRDATLRWRSRSGTLLPATFHNALAMRTGSPHLASQAVTDPQYISMMVLIGVCSRPCRISSVMQFFAGAAGWALCFLPPSAMPPLKIGKPELTGRGRFLHSLSLHTIRCPDCCSIDTDPAP